jgi:hypothetical protein
MSIIEKTSQKIIMDRVLHKYMMSVPKNKHLRIFIDQNRLDIFDGVNHKNISAHVFLDTSEKICDYVKVHVHNINLQKNNMTVRINFVNSTENMVENIRDFFSNNKNEYGIVASQNTMFEKILQELDTSNALYYRIDDLNIYARSMDAKNFDSNMWRIFRC